VLLPQCDFVFDFHSGGSSLTYVPSALMRRPQTPETRIMESGIRRVLAKVEALSGEPPLAAAETRIMQVRGQDYYVHAPDPGLFEPLVELGEEVTEGTPAAIIHPHDTPWREPAIAAFGRAGTVICKRVPGRVERGDCLFHLADDFVP
jgi:predicted deacylase